VDNRNGERLFRVKCAFDLAPPNRDKLNLLALQSEGMPQKSRRLSTEEILDLREKEMLSCSGHARHQEQCRQPRHGDHADEPVVLRYVASTQTSVSDPVITRVQMLLSDRNDASAEPVKAE
jgi:hypothetical protein